LYRIVDITFRTGTEIMGKHQIRFSGTHYSGSGTGPEQKSGQQPKSARRSRKFGSHIAGSVTGPETEKCKIRHNPNSNKEEYLFDIIITLSYLSGNYKC